MSLPLYHICMFSFCILNCCSFLISINWLACVIQCGCLHSTMIIQPIQETQVVTFYSAVDITSEHPIQDTMDWILPPLFGCFTEGCQTLGSGLLSIPPVRQHPPQHYQSDSQADLVPQLEDQCSDQGIFRPCDHWLLAKLIGTASCQRK